MEKKNTIKKFFAIVLSILLVFAGLYFGIIGALAGAALAGLLLQKMNVVSPDSVWVKETKSLKIAKYIILFLVLAAIIIAFVYIILNQ